MLSVISVAMYRNNLKNSHDIDIILTIFELRPRRKKSTELILYCAETAINLNESDYHDILNLNPFFDFFKQTKIECKFTRASKKVDDACNTVLPFGTNRRKIRGLT
jgi:hypothetical protein